MAKSPNVADCVRQGAGRYNFGQSLYLVVRGGSALWEAQFRQNKVLRTKSYGSAISRNGCDPVTLTQARARKAADWLELRGDRQQQRQTAGTPKLFSVARDEYLAKHSAEWSPAQMETIKRMMAKHAAPLDDKRVDRITKEELGDLLRPIWKGPGSHTGNRVRSMVEKILSYADVQVNPARWDVLRNELSNKIVKTINHPALPYPAVPPLMGELAVDPSMQARALRFVILTAVRLDEVLEATWREFDLVGKIWTIPAERMKMSDPHQVPLSDEAIAVLKDCPSGADDALVFPSKLGGRMSQQTLRELAQDLRPGVTVHGFRTSFSTWAEEQDDGRAYPHPIIKAAIAHYKGDSNTKAYLRSSLFKPRQKLMEAWARFATGNNGPRAIVEVHRFT
jgi:integrase